LEKREVKLNFLINGRLNPSEVSVKRQRIPDTTTDEIVLSFALINDSGEDVASGHAEISVVCDTGDPAAQCNAIRFVGVDPWPFWGDTGREVAKDFIEIIKHSSFQLGRVALTSETGSFPQQIRLALRYRCLLCVPEEWRFVTLSLVP
jgi:hypothetical protein